MMTDSIYLCHVDDQLGVVPVVAVAALLHPVLDSGHQVVCYLVVLALDFVLVLR